MHAPRTSSSDKGKGSSIPQSERDQNRAELYNIALTKMIKEIKTLSEKVVFLSDSVSSLADSFYRNNKKVADLEELYASLAQKHAATPTSPFTELGSVSFSPILAEFSARLDASESANKQIAVQIEKMTNAVASLVQVCERLVNDSSVAIV